MITSPQEIEVWYILPALRKELTDAFIRKGLKQKDIAGLLGVTEAAVSQYKANKRACSVDFNAKMKKEIESSAENILEDKDSLIVEINKLCILVKDEQILCKVHKNKDKALPEGCSLCWKGCENKQEH